jgi:hypothetical protein
MFKKAELLGFHEFSERRFECNGAVHYLVKLLKEFPRVI